MRPGYPHQPYGVPPQQGPPGQMVCPPGQVPGYGIPPNQMPVYSSPPNQIPAYGVPPGQVGGGYGGAPGQMGGGYGSPPGQMGGGYGGPPGHMTGPPGYTGGHYGSPPGQLGGGYVSPPGQPGGYGSPPMGGAHGHHGAAGGHGHRGGHCGGHGHAGGGHGGHGGHHQHASPGGGVGSPAGQARQIKVRIISASDMPRTAGLFDKTDPFVEIVCGGFSQRTTAKKNAGTAATWNETFTLNYTGDPSLVVNLYDEDKRSSSLLGTATLRLDRDVVNGRFAGDVNVMDKKGKGKGRINLEVRVN
eukprot:Blabericola_migrator_1__8713@NODE_4591_length_1069_cov_242_802395_g2851_i0_p1_GENE_NODE_4591_length_1069_cov_242_802395_g2851_i0NODE_4591_length_1069_cov_242_802395_g2851_i0_p1_ORF_typecomplete_len302_score29_31C2/PF00168_30/4_3e14C2C2_1/PF11618_8/0_07_NODE_4591_length_1069_cov_242_802395_g2851_i01211026